MRKNRLGRKIIFFKTAEILIYKQKTQEAPSKSGASVDKETKKLSFFPQMLPDLQGVSITS